MVIDDVVMTMRVLLAVLAVVVVPVAVGGFISFSRRSGQTLCNAVRAMAFMTAFSSGSYQWAFFLGRQPVTAATPTVVLSLSLTLSTMIVSALLLFRLRGRRTMEMAHVEEHLDVSLAIAELDILAPDEARMYATECRRRIAEIMIDRGRVPRV